LKQVLGTKAEYSLEDGVRDYLENYLCYDQ
jgi:nucleoside-diphosphate-sugar epimerase